jgi:hypothetical protein
MEVRAMFHNLVAFTNKVTFLYTRSMDFVNGLFVHFLLAFVVKGPYSPLLIYVLYAMQVEARQFCCA